MLVLGLGAGAAIQLARPVPTPVIHPELTSSYRDPGTSAELPWSAGGESAIALTGFGWLGSTAREIPVPIASVTKIMTALVILRAHPLTVGTSGPTITVSAAAYATYRSELAVGDSVVGVTPGETLTELQLLEGLLLPSGDNLAVILADWESGSEAAFVVQMNQLAASLALSGTHFTDSSGLESGSVSTARDLVTLAESAMTNPVFAMVVALPAVTLPVAGTVRNYNPILGQDRVVGVKTGWTAAALGCLVFAANVMVGGRSLRVVGAVLGQPGGPVSGLAAAGRAAIALLAAATGELEEVRLPGRRLQVGTISSAWAPEIDLVVRRRVGLVGLRGARLAVQFKLRRPSAPSARGAGAGLLTVTTPGGFAYQEPAVLAQKLAAPSLWWRLTRPW